MTMHFDQKKFNDVKNFVNDLKFLEHKEILNNMLSLFSFDGTYFIIDRKEYLKELDKINTSLIFYKIKTSFVVMLIGARIPNITI